MKGWDIVFTYRGLAGELPRENVEMIAAALMRKLVQVPGGPAGWACTIFEADDE